MSPKTPLDAGQAACERSAMRQFHLLFLYMLVGVGAFAASPLWFGPILTHAVAAHEALANQLAAHPVAAWATVLGLSLVVTYGLGLYLFMERDARFDARPVRRLLLLGALALLSGLYLLLESAVPTLPATWWVDYITNRVSIDAPLEQLTLVIRGLYALAHLADVLLLSSAILGFMVLTCASPKQIEADD